MSLRGASSFAAPAPLLAFCLRWSGACLQVSTQTEAQTYGLYRLHQSGLCAFITSQGHDFGAGGLWTIVGSCSDSSRGSLGAGHDPTLRIWAAACLPRWPQRIPEPSFLAHV